MILRYFEIPLIDIIPKREMLQEIRVNPMSETPHKVNDYFTIYNQGGNVIKREGPFLKNEPAKIEYRGIIFLASEGYEDATITIEWNSLINFVKDDGQETIPFEEIPC